MITSGFQRGLMKAVGASAGTLRRVVGVHLTQGLHGCQHALRGRRGAQFQHLQQGRRVTAQGGEVLADQCRWSKPSGRASSSASLTLSVNSSRESPPRWRHRGRCRFPSLPAAPGRSPEYRRTLSLIALPCFWNCC